MRYRVNKVKKLCAEVRNEENEKGVVAVIVALILAALMGFASLAIDESAWLVKQRQYQNAADAIALDACNKKYRTRNQGTYSDETIKQDGIALALKNGVEIDDPAQLTLQYDDAQKKVTATISKPTDNYFLVAVNGQKKTNIKVNSTAQIGSTSTPGSKFHYGSAVESQSNIDWGNGENLTNITGGVSCEGTFTDTCKGSFHDGGITANGDILLANISDIQGDIRTMGKVTINSGIQFGGNINANVSVTNSNPDASFKEVHSPTVSLGDNYKNKSDGSNHEVIENPNVSAYSWEAKWGQLRNDINARISKGDFYEVDQGVIEEYSKTDSNCSWSGGLTINNNFDFQKFYNYCKEKYKADHNGKEPDAIYIKGSLTNNSNSAFTFSGNIITDGDINRFARDGVTITDGSLISLGGNITTQGATLNCGSLIALGGSINIQKGNSNTTTTINGAVSAAGNITVSGDITVTDNTKWTIEIDPSDDHDIVRLSA